MYSVRTVTFSIFFCCHFIYSWQDSETLLERYYNYLRMLSEDELLKMKTELHPICYCSNIYLATVCDYVLYRIRHEEDEYRNILFVNYRAFNNLSTTSSKCQENYVTIGTLIIPQSMVQCIGRRQINSEEESVDGSPFYRKIFMFPESDTSMIVFSFNSETNTFTLLTIYDGVPWNGLLLVPPELLTLKPPKSITSSNKISKFLRPYLGDITEISADKNHFMNFTNEKNGQYPLYLCQQFYRRPEYSNLIALINYNSSSLFPKLEKQLVVVTHNDTSIWIPLEFNAWAYSCPCTIYRKKNEQINTK